MKIINEYKWMKKKPQILVEKLIINKLIDNKKINEWIYKINKKQYKKSFIFNFVYLFNLLNLILGELFNYLFCRHLFFIV